MVCENGVIVELFANYPEGIYWVFEILAHMQLIVCLVNGKETEL